MPVEPRISQHPSSDGDKIKLTFELSQASGGHPASPGEGLASQPGQKAGVAPGAAAAGPGATPGAGTAVGGPNQTPDRVTSPEAQAQAALQLRQVRAPALAEARAEEEEEAELAKEQAIQSVETPTSLEASGQADMTRLRQQREEQIKKAQAKFKEKSEFEKKKAQIIKEYKEKAKKKAEKYAKVAKEKIQQMLGEAFVTIVQELGPIIMEIITYLCTFGLGLCGTVDWVFDAFVSLWNLFLRAVTQFQRVKKMVGLAQKSEVDHVFKELTEKFLAQTVLPVVGGSILEMIPYLDYGWWEETGVAISGLLIVYDLLKSYRKAKSIENEARSMAA